MTEETKNSKPGRKKKTDGPAFPRNEVDKLLVYGEEVKDETGRRRTVKYPSYREVARRYGVAHSLIAAFSKDNNCLVRRERVQIRTTELSDERLANLRADHLALTRDDLLRSIDKYILSFEEELREGRIKMADPGDFNTMVRLRVFLIGQLESSNKEAMNGLPTLEEIQQRHAELLRRRREATSALCGVSPKLFATINEEDSLEALPEARVEVDVTEEVESESSEMIGKN